MYDRYEDAISKIWATNELASCLSSVFSFDYFSTMFINDIVDR